MQPGRASHQPPQFPDAWCGLWQDLRGKIMYIRRVQGRHLAVSFAPGVEQPFSPQQDAQDGLARNLPALYQLSPLGGLYLRIDVGIPGIGPFYDVHFNVGEGDRMRPAEGFDSVENIIARPGISETPVMEGDPLIILVIPTNTGKALANHTIWG